MTFFVVVYYVYVSNAHFGKYIFNNSSCRPDVFTLVLFLVPVDKFNYAIPIIGRGKK